MDTSRGGTMSIRIPMGFRVFGALGLLPGERPLQFVFRKSKPSTMLFTKGSIIL